MPKKLTLEFIKKVTQETDDDCLADKYINSYTKMPFRCHKCKQIFWMSWACFKYQNQRCAKCHGNKKLTMNDITKEMRIIAPKYTLLTKEYINNKTKMEFVCPEGHIFWAQWDSFSNSNGRCAKCHHLKITEDQRFTIQDINADMKLLAPDYNLLTTNYIDCLTKMKFMCPEGHIFWMNWHSFKNKHSRCSKCFHLKNAEDKRLSIETIKNETTILAKGYRLLSTEYINNGTKLKFKCSKNHEFEASWNGFKQGGRCPQCWVDPRKIHDKTALQNIIWYRSVVTRYSNENYYNYFYQINPNKLQRSFTEYHLDHIYTVIDGFNEGILPQIIANPTNLQMLPASENISKNGKSSITKKELFEKYTEFEKSSTNHKNSQAK